MRTRAVRTLLVLVALGCSDDPAPSESLDASLPDASAALKIAPPPAGQMYLGQNQLFDDDIAFFEQAAGRRAALFYREIPMRGGEGEPPTFDPAVAARAWDEGYVVLVHAYEATPGPDRGAFTVDRLLAGAYDDDLTRLAAQFRAFGRPMFFSTAREPNGVISQYMGGFGPDGSQSLRWALDNERGLADFDPTGLPNAELYADLGDATKCDGLERLVAAQRYYHDFFVRREGLSFLTFDTMGWNAFVPAPPEDDGHRARLVASCFDYANLYPGDAYVDWVSLNYYQFTFEADVGEIPLATNVAMFDATMDVVRRVAPGKPVLITEFGSPLRDPEVVDSAENAERTRAALEQLLTYAEVGGVAFWTRSIGDGIDTLVRPGTAQAAALRAVVEAHGDRFVSCVRLSDGSIIPNCDPADLTPLVGGGVDGEACAVDDETGVWCSEPDRCSSGEWVDGCCIAGRCAG